MTPLPEPQVRLPRQVRERFDRANELVKRDAAVPEPEPAKPEAQTPPPSSGPVEPPVLADPKPKQMPHDDPRYKDLSYWQTRCNVLDGFLKELRSTRATEMSAAQERISALERQVQELETKAQESSPSEVDLTKWWSAEQIELLGKDEATAMATAIERQSRAIAAAEYDRRMKPILEKQEREETAERRRLTDEFFDHLAREVPNWQEINETEEWIMFLRQDDPSSGLIRQIVIDQAMKQGKPGAIVRLLKEYIRTLGPADVAPTPAVLPNGGQAGGQGAGTAPPTQRHPTAYEAKQFYTDVTKGRYRGKPQEEAAFLARIEAARQAGAL